MTLGARACERNWSKTQLSKWLKVVIYFSACCEVIIWPTFGLFSSYHLAKGYGYYLGQPTCTTFIVASAIFGHSVIILCFVVCQLCFLVVQRTRIWEIASFDLILVNYCFLCMQKHYKIVVLRDLGYLHVRREKKKKIVIA